jgi:hypothetical protein
MKQAKGMKIKVFTLGLLAFAPLSLQAANVSTAGRFLDFGLGARPVAMAEAYTAFGQDLPAMDYNPGALSACPYSLMAGYQRLLAEVNGTWLAGCYPALSGRVMASIRQVDFGVVEDAVMGSSGLVETKSSLRPYAFAASLGWSRELFSGLSAGGLGTYLGEEVGPDRSRGWAGSFGILKRDLVVSGLNLGLSLRNWGSMDDGTGLPSQGRAGVSYLANLGKAGRLAVSTDAVLTQDHAFSSMAGAEWRPLPDLWARGGYRSDSSTYGLGGTSGLCFGFGFSFSSLVLDFAYVPAGELGSQQRLTLTWVSPDESAKVKAKTGSAKQSK